MLLHSPPTAALGKDCCSIIAHYCCPCLVEGSFVTSQGLIFPVPPAPSSSARTRRPAPLRLRPPLASPSTCFAALPPSCIGFGISGGPTIVHSERRRAAIALYSAHSFVLSHCLYFPYQTDFLTAAPSVSSMLPLPPSATAASSSSSYSTLLAALDDLGNLCIWRWQTAELLFHFTCRPPVFFSMSSLCALPSGKLAVLLSGCPGPQHPASRLTVLDLLTGERWQAEDDDNQPEQLFPLTLFFPRPTLPSASPSLSPPPKLKASPFSLYSNDSLWRWHHNGGAVELQPVLLPPLPAPSTSPPRSFSPPLPSFLHTASCPWQPLGHQAPAPASYHWKHFTEAVRWDAAGRVVRVEGGLGVVRVFVGHHADRGYSGQWEFAHDQHEEEEAKEEGEEGEGSADRRTEDSSEAEEAKAGEEEKKSEVFLSVSGSRPVVGIEDAEEEEASQGGTGGRLSSAAEPVSPSADDEHKAAADDDRTSSFSSSSSSSPTSPAASRPIRIPPPALSSTAVPPRSRSQSHNALVLPMPPLLPVPLLFHRRRRRRVVPPHLHVSAAFTSTGLLVISSRVPESAELGGDRRQLLSGWRLLRDSEDTGEVRGECAFMWRLDDAGSLLCADAAAKVAQRQKGARTFLFG